jgi:hypothetical protein
MTHDEWANRIDEIVKRLSAIAQEDMAIIQPRSSQPVVIQLEALMAYGRRHEERDKLHEELRGFCTNKP